MGLKYRIDDQSGLYFVTFTVINWIDLFTRDGYREIFINSVKYCQKHKGLKVSAWVIMTNHVHMILSTEGSKLQDIVRDLKSYISRHVRLEIEQNSSESRKDWMMWLFKKAGLNNTNNNDFQFWIQDNHPILLSTGEKAHQKLEYIHNNPVRAGFVCEAEHWKWSSAHDYCGGTQGLLELVMID